MGTGTEGKEAARVQNGGGAGGGLGEEVDKVLDEIQNVLGRGGANSLSRSLLGPTSPLLAA